MVESNFDWGESMASWSQEFAEAVRLHHLGVEGDKAAVQKAYALLDKLRQQVNDNLVHAYYGSVLTLVGRDAINPTERVQKALQGVKILNEAVAKEPNNVEIRLLRGFVCNRLPKVYFHRTATAVEDFNHVLALDAKKHLLSKELYWKVLFELGDAYKKLGQHEQAKAVWSRLKSQTSRYDQELRKHGF